MNKKKIPAGEVVTGNVLKNQDDNYINSTILGAIMEETGKDSITLTIDRLEFHNCLTYANGQKSENASLLYFQPIKGWSFADKPLELNKTNMKRIVGMYGAIGANWSGKQIQLHTEIAFRPDIKTKGPCVRVKPQARKGF